ncbi:antitoxin VapB [Sphingomonas insulae]|uniref:Type II toxin-antitoxin system VapB family antitoxin n=1 Tax=Sphingomonas insulae TaxID=424800 RepID=A0ABN1HKX9_9SPHN|nr:type II toxin-antitoxin system VapB family antitoxin [Sphingomonas insulae]NIJ30417.1 antitoxin VapB [Sphingomonas insulae]
MGIHIDQTEVEQAIHALAELRGQSPLDTIGQVMMSELSRELSLRVNLSPERRTWLDDVRQVQARIRTLPVLDPRSPDEILYDEDGLPR